MVFCAAYGCTNSTEKAICREKRISFHSFPLKDPIRLKRWLINIKRKYFKPNEASKLCSEHFLEKYFAYQNFTNRRGLTSDAVPTIFSFTQQPKRKGTSYAFGKVRVDKLPDSDSRQSKQTHLEAGVKGRPANHYDIENPDWVPTLNMGYEVENSEKQNVISPHVQYIKTDTSDEDELLGSSDDGSVNEDSDSKEFVEDTSDMFVKDEIVSDTQQSADSEEDTNSPPDTNENDLNEYENTEDGERNSVEENASDDDINLPDTFIAYNKLVTNHINFGDDESEGENSLDESETSERGHKRRKYLHNVLSKKTQTDLTMNDLDKISEAFRASVLEVKRLKAKMKSFTEDILHLNEVYC